MSQTHPLIEAFVEEYNRDQTKYQEIAELVERICKESLPDTMAIFSCRAKSVKSLRDKLYKKLDKRRKTGMPDYQERRDILLDAIDLAGVRIALFFPVEWIRVGQVIGKLFDLPPTEIEHMANLGSVTGRKKRGRVERDADAATIDTYGNSIGRNYQTVFKGYDGKHFRVRLKTEHRDPDANWPEDCIVEIQVTSVLVHAWAEIEHDLKYKRIHGKASLIEERILDCLDGLVHSCEVLLEQLYEGLVQQKRPFRSKYELGDFLEKKLIDDNPQLFSNTEENNPLAGSTKVLHKFLKVVGKNSPNTLTPVLDELDFTKKGHNELLDAIAKKYQPFKLMPPMYIMDHLLGAFTPDAPPYAIGLSTGSGESCYSAKLRVLISSVIWLYDLFDSNWSYREAKINRTIGLHEDAHEFLFGSVDRAEIIEGELEPKKDQAKYIDDIWALFEHETDAMFQFVFKISCMGVQEKLPDKLLKLRKANRSKFAVFSQNGKPDVNPPPLGTPHGGHIQDQGHSQDSVDGHQTI